MSSESGLESGSSRCSSKKPVNSQGPGIDASEIESPLRKCPGAITRGVVFLRPLPDPQESTALSPGKFGHIN